MNLELFILGGYIVLFCFVTYSNLSKEKMLGVSKKTLKKYGAVSWQVAREMASSAAIKANADIGIGITGIAGPGGATKNKKVGDVYIAISDIKNNSGLSYDLDLKGSREQIRLSSVDCALDLLIKYILNPKKES